MKMMNESFYVICIPRILFKCSNLLKKYKKSDKSENVFAFQHFVLRWKILLCTLFIALMQTRVTYSIIHSSINIKVSFLLEGARLGNRKRFKMSHWKLLHTNNWFSVTSRRQLIIIRKEKFLFFSLRSEKMIKVGQPF